MSIGTTIKRLRRERDMTQEQLADYLGITSRGFPSGNARHGKETAAESVEGIGRIA